MRKTNTKVAVEYQDTGSGKLALLCMPGWCAESSVFDPLVAEIGKDHRVLALNWRGHGGSDDASGDFGASELVDDAIAVIEDAGVSGVVPVALAHAGWVAIELCRRRPSLVKALILVDWIVFDPPPPFISALKDFQVPDRCAATREKLFSMWLQGVDSVTVQCFVHEVMGSYDDAMWSRAGREIAASYRREGNPLNALEKLEPSIPVLHLYAQPEEETFYENQLAYARENPWYQVLRVAAKSHFPMLECPQDMAVAIKQFLDS